MTEASRGVVVSVEFAVFVVSGCRLFSVAFFLSSLFCRLFFVVSPLLFLLCLLFSPFLQDHSSADHPATGHDDEVDDQASSAHACGARRDHARLPRADGPARACGGRANVSRAAYDAGSAGALHAQQGTWQEAQQAGGHHAELGRLHRPAMQAAQAPYVHRGAKQ